MKIFLERIFSRGRYYMIMSYFIKIPYKPFSKIRNIHSIIQETKILFMASKIDTT